MALACAECGAIDSQDQVNVKVVCHHCGKPLCDEHCVWIVDDAFSDRAALTWPEPRDNLLAAVLEGLMWLGSQIRRGLALLGLLGMSRSDAERVAYHCETCCEDNHPWVMTMRGRKLP